MANLDTVSKDGKETLPFQSDTKFGIAYSSFGGSPLDQANGDNLHRSQEWELDESDVNSNSGALNSSNSSSNLNDNQAAITHAETLMSPYPPRVSRAFSMPLASQLGHLQNPHRSVGANSPPPSSITTLATSSAASFPPLPENQALSSIHAFSLELADSLQMAIQTLLQVAPPQILDPALEQFSGCFLSIPTTSMCSLLTLMKTLNYMAANIHILAFEDSHDLLSPRRDKFDLGEMVQSVGDALSGIAAQSAVDIVLFHGDVGMKHIAVKGDECGLSFALSHVLRQILAVTVPGDTIEVGLLIKSAEAAGGSSGGRGALRVTIELAHKRFSDGNPNFTSLRASFQNSIFTRLLLRIGATVSSDLHVEEGHTRTDHRYYLSTVLDHSLTRDDAELLLSAEETAIRQPFPDIQLAGEPSLSELTAFAETLRGKKVALHASSGGPFARCLSSNLTAWGMDVQHISTDDGGSRITDDSVLGPSERTGYGSHDGDIISQEDVREPPGIPSFILIDDDIPALRKRILELRKEPQYNLRIPARRRPNLNHRPKSSSFIPPIQQRSDAATSRLLDSSVSIIHFTSLGRYKLVRDLIQGITDQCVNSAHMMPDIIAIPKPAGPRRILTALHTAVKKPLVDPLFAPIATSPPSPSLGNGVFNTLFGRESPAIKARTPPESRTRPYNNALTRSPREQTSSNMGGHLHPSSPLAVELEATDYFPDSSIRTLGQSPSSGMLIQSPNGQPAGIYFQPPSRTLKSQAGGKPMKRETAVSSTGGLHGEVRSATPRSQSSSVAPLNSAFRSPEATLIESHTAPQASPTHSFHRSPIGQKLSPSRRFPDGRPMTIEQTAQTTPPAASNNEKLEHLSPSVTSESKVRITSNDSTPPPHVGSGKVGSSVNERRLPVKKNRAIDNTIVPPINVLIVEDNPINQTILQTFMRRNKIQHDTAKNGKEAIDKYQSGTFHLILMDIQMPVMDGIEATKEIRRLEAESNIMPLTPSLESARSLNVNPNASVSASRSPGNTFSSSSVIIVALTASSLQSDRVNALAAGCNDFLTKPVSLLWLNNKIIEWGSLKALQMYANGSSQFLATMDGQRSVQTKEVANRMKMPAVRENPIPDARFQKDTSPKPASATPPSATAAKFDVSRKTKGRTRRHNAAAQRGAFDSSSSGGSLSSEESDHDRKLSTRKDVSSGVAAMRPQ